MRLKPKIILGRPNDKPDLSPRNVVRSVNFWIVVGYSLLFLILYQYCRVAYNRDPTSYFFEPSKGYAKSYSLRRERQAQAFIESHNGTANANPSSKHPSICVGLATIARSGEQYIRNTIGSLFEGLSEKQRDEIHLTVFFAQTDPPNHPIYSEPWLKNVADETVEYQVSEEDMAQLKSWEDQHQFWNKSMYDYNYPLERCLKTEAKWIMIVEDDVLAKAGWYTEATATLADIVSQTKGSQWLYLRLFYTEKLFGWNGEEWFRYLGWSILAFLVTASGLIGARSCSKRLKKHMSNINVALICGFCLPATIILYFMAGRVSMQPHSRGL